ncbi:MAG: hypothetical protein R3D85_08180 [Paracoccaceae bacterium]
MAKGSGMIGIEGRLIGEVFDTAVAQWGGRDFLNCARRGARGRNARPDLCPGG